MAAVCARPGCVRPAFLEPRTNIKHSFCGRTHALAARVDIKDPHGDCHRCHLQGCTKNVFFEKLTGRVHEFCSKDHADKAIASLKWPQPKRLQRSSSETVSSLSCCQFPNCSLPVAIDSANLKYDYCGRTHAKEHALVKSTIPQLLPKTPVILSSLSGISAAPGIKISAPVCIICLEPNANTVLIPCGHMCMCHVDAEQLKISQNLTTCPLCKAAVTSMQKVHGLY